MDATRGARRAHAKAMVCTAIGLLAMFLAPAARSESPTPNSLPHWVDTEATSAFVFPPRSEAPTPRPVTVLLHGLCGHPESACAPFVESSTSRGWLVCPRGEESCAGGSRWRLSAAEDARLVEASVSALAREHDGEVDGASARVLVGFSLGGIAAVRIAESERGRRYAGLVVIASQVHPDASLLLRAGVRRVVLAAGDLDMTSAPLQKDGRLLEQAGLPTRFVSLGRFGHGYPPDMDERMREPMAWVAGVGPS